MRWREGGGEGGGKVWSRKINERGRDGWNQDGGKNKDGEMR